MGKREEKRQLRADGAAPLTRWMRVGGLSWSGDGEDEVVRGGGEKTRQANWNGLVRDRPGATKRFWYGSGGGHWHWNELGFLTVPTFGTYLRYVSEKESPILSL